MCVDSLYLENFNDRNPALKQLLGIDKPNPLGITKTHDYPNDESPTIYVIRDGRAAIVSYFYYTNTYNEPRTMRQIIQGDVAFGSWSAHYHAWKPASRPNTLFLRYEDIVQNVDSAIMAISIFLNIEPTRTFQLNFTDMHAIEPTFFREGDNSSNLSKLTSYQLAEFEEIHAETMRELGYTIDKSRAL